MERFAINISIPEYETVTIEDARLRSAESEVVLVLDESTSTTLHLYYSGVIEIILSGARLITVSIGSESKIRKAIMMVMANYHDYNIYKVSDRSLLTPEYLRNICSRTPDICEVQQYIGGDVSAYSDINTILFGINNLIQIGDLDGLKVFVEQHVDSLENSIGVIEYLKKIADTNNSGELTDVIEKLKEKIGSYEKENSTLGAELRQYKGENERLTDKINLLNRDIAKVSQRATELSEQLSSSGPAPVISTYSEINTSVIKCKTQCIIYFKEISYSLYANSLVLNLFEIIKQMMSGRSGQPAHVKLMIYDNRVGLPGLYKGISILGTQEYLSNKANILKSTTRFVVAEPNQMFLDDVLTSTNPRFDVVIIYDRMRQSNDLVSGNNVTKIYVVNSASNLAAARESTRIANGAMVISHDPNISDAISIREIEDYNTATESAKLTRYTRLTVSETSKQKIISSILDKARLQPGVNGVQ